jgi:hypothetical protein
MTGIHYPMASGGNSDFTQGLSAQVSGGGGRPVALWPGKEKCGRGNHQAQRVGGLHGRPATLRQPREDAVRDFFVENGLVYDRAYLAGPRCAPSRATMQLGRYPHSHNILDNKGAAGQYKNAGRQHESAAPRGRVLYRPYREVDERLRGPDEHQQRLGASVLRPVVRCTR